MITKWNCFLEIKYAVTVINTLKRLAVLLRLGEWTDLINKKIDMVRIDAIQTSQYIRKTRGQIKSLASDCGSGT